MKELKLALAGAVTLQEKLPIKKAIEELKKKPTCSGHTYIGDESVILAAMASRIKEVL